MFCQKCGTEMNGNQFCPGCGAQSTEAAGPKPAGRTEGNALQENMAGLLCYVLGWVTGIIFILIDKRPFVRFHAVQSIVAFGAISVFTFVFGRIIAIFPYGLWKLLSGVNTLISLGSIVLAVFLMVQAHKGKLYKLPVAGDVAEKHAGKR